MTAPTVYVALSQFCEESDLPEKTLRQAGLQVRRNSLGRRLRKEDMMENLAGADAVLAGVEPYDGEILSQLPRLKCISRCGTGTDSIDLKEAKRRNIAVYTTPEEAVEPTAQLTVAMILALARQFPLYGEEMRQGIWRKRTGSLLSEWTIGLIGFGRIGQCVERYLRPFQPKILVADPLQREGVPGGVTACSLSALVSQADLVSIHASRRS